MHNQRLINMIRDIKRKGGQDVRDKVGFGFGGESSNRVYSFLEGFKFVFFTENAAVLSEYGEEVFAHEFKVLFEVFAAVAGINVGDQGQQETPSGV